MILALAALWIQVLIPQGFMVAQASTGPALVICTGHGPLQSPDHSGKAPKPTSDAPCVFAAHGAVSAPPLPALLAAPDFAPVTIAAQSFVTQSPGRGLAAPPPPSQGPPQLA
jgi:hypothetical protein